jgi:hypothetical protein
VLDDPVQPHRERRRRATLGAKPAEPEVALRDRADRCKQILQQADDEDPRRDCDERDRDRSAHTEQAEAVRLKRR